MNVDELVDKACKSTGLGPFANASYREGLEVLVAEINACAVATDRSHALMEQQILLSLTNRFRVENYLLQHPELPDTPVKRPVFVFGMPRTGTTLASHLLGADPQRRSLLNWEAVDSIPPPTTATLYTDARCVEKRRAQEEMLQQNPDMVLPHWEFADDPTECIFVMSQDFKAMSWEARLPMPGYSRWLVDCDMTSAYQYHKKVLQILQSRAPGTWNLKMPSHAIFLDTLLKVFPDARLIWTHRDPYQTFASSCSLLRVAQSYSGYTPDPAWIGSNTVRRMAAHLRGAMATKDRLGDKGIYDLHYNRMMSDPIAEMRRLYAWLGDDFSADVEQHLRSWLATHPQGQLRPHKYSLAEFGQTRESLEPLFGEYLRRYKVELSS